MKRDHFGRPVCLGQGPARRCGTPVHPGYSRCYNCDRVYTSDQMAASLAHPQNAGARSLHRGKMYLCTICRTNSVDAESGYDTCQTCLDKQ